MSHHADADAPGRLEPAELEPGTRDDLAAIVDILSYTIMNSNATFSSQPICVADRLEWLERFGRQR